MAWDDLDVAWSSRTLSWDGAVEAVSVGVSGDTAAAALAAVEASVSLDASGGLSEAQVVDVVNAVADGVVGDYALVAVGSVVLAGSLGLASGVQASGSLGAAVAVSFDAQGDVALAPSVAFGASISAGLSAGATMTGVADAAPAGSLGLLPAMTTVQAADVVDAISMPSLVRLQIREFPWGSDDVVAQGWTGVAGLTQSWTADAALSNTWTKEKKL